MNEETDPLWKQVWKTEGIRYLGKEKTGYIDAMDRFEHAFKLGQQSVIDSASADLEVLEARISDIKKSIRRVIAHFQ
jgi:hypothetical protein